MIYDIEKLRFGENKFSKYLTVIGNKSNWCYILYFSLANKAFSVGRWQRVKPLSKQEACWKSARCLGKLWRRGQGLRRAFKLFLCFYCVISNTMVKSSKKSFQKQLSNLIFVAALIHKLNKIHLPVNIQRDSQWKKKKDR